MFPYLLIGQLKKQRNSGPLSFLLFIYGLEALSCGHFFFGTLLGNTNSAIILWNFFIFFIARDLEYKSVVGVFLDVLWLVLYLQQFTCVL
jgi:hypothetical protein